MENATIGDDVRTLYKFDWGDHSRTTDEIGDLEEAGFSCDIDDIVNVAKEDPECDVKIAGFEES